MQEIACQSCGAVFKLADRALQVTCTHCGSSAFVDRPASLDRPDPVFLLPFEIDMQRAGVAASRWVRSRGFFVRSDFKRASVRGLRGVYLPGYLYNAVAHVDYQADCGVDYTVRTDKGSRTETEWTTLVGRQSSYVLDVLVSASCALADRVLERIEPFAYGRLRRFEPALVAGWIAEEPTVSRGDCLEQSRHEARTKLERLLPSFLPGDRKRDVEASTTLESEELDLVMVPIWMFAVRYGEKATAHIFVNGQTGRAGGIAPVSHAKIVATFVAAVVFVIAAVVAYKYMPHARYGR